jgi:hypothetical protein
MFSSRSGYVLEPLHLVAILLETKATLTDEILDLLDRFTGGLFNKAKRKHDEAFQASGKAAIPGSANTDFVSRRWRPKLLQ